MLHKSPWRRLPLTHHKAADNPQTGKQLNQRNSHTVAKVLGPRTDFPSWGSGKGTENTHEIWRPVRFDYRTSTGLGSQTFGGHKQNFVHTRTKEKGAVTPEETEPALPGSVQASPVEVRVNRGLLWGQRHWMQQFWEWRHAGISSFEGGWHLALGQITGREHSPTHQQKIGLKIYWACPRPSEQDPVSPQPVPPFRELPKASYSYPSESRQNENQSYWKLKLQPT